MRKITSQSYAPQTLNEGGPVRKLAAAVKAVMEPMENRQMMSASPAALVNHQVTSITAKYETQPVAHAGAAATDSAIWVNPTDPSKSAIIGTDKKGAINVYDLSGNVISSLTENAYTNVDIRNNFTLGGKQVTLVVASNITQNKVSVFTLNPSTRTLNYVAARSIYSTSTGQMTSLTMYHSADTGKTFVLVSTNTGAVQEFELSDNGKGKIVGKSVRTFQVGSDVEGMVADDETGALYVSERNVGIWKYGAEPTDGSVRVQVDGVGAGGHLTDAEGLALYKTDSGSGYLIASSQGSSDYVVYDRATNAYVTRFEINESDGSGKTSSTGIAVTNASLGGGLPEGTFVVEDSNPGSNQNFKIVSWGDIARSQAVPLSIDGTQNPSEVTTPAVPTSGGTATAQTPVTDSVAMGVKSLSVYKANTDSSLRTITNGAVIDLADFKGVDVNIRANVQGTIGSVKFGVNGVSNYHIENFESFDIAGTAGVWTPTVGTYTISATAYSDHKAAGTASATYTVSFTVVDTRTAPAPVTTPVTTPVSTPAAPVTTPTAQTTPTTPSTPVTTTPAPDPVVVKGRPSASTTGPASGTKLTNVTNFKAASNTTYSNLHISGQVTLTGLSNVTLINCVIDGNSSVSYGVRCDNATNITIQNCEIVNITSAGIYGDHFKAIGNFIHQSGGDGIKPISDALIQGNYITALGYNSPLAHADGVQIRGGSNFTIVGNFFDLPNDVANTKANSALFLQLTASNVTFDNNWVLGGNFAIHAYSDTPGANSTIRINDNTFYSGTTQFGFGSVGSGVVWTGNTNSSGTSVLSSSK